MTANCWPTAVVDKKHKLPLLFVPKQQRFVARYVRMADATTESAAAEKDVANVTTAASATTRSPQHGPIQQPHPSVVQMVPQQPAAMMAGSYPAATYPNVFYQAQSGTVQFM